MTPIRSPSNAQSNVPLQIPSEALSSTPSVVPSMAPSPGSTQLRRYSPSMSPSTAVPTVVPLTVSPTLLSQNADASVASRLTTPVIAGIAVLFAVCLVAVIFVIVYYYCIRKKNDKNGNIELREWIQANKDTVDVAVFDSPTYRKSVLEPRASEAPPQATPRFSLFNQNPFDIAFRSNKPTTTAAVVSELDVTMDEQYHTQGDVVVPDTANPQSNRHNSVRIHLPITRDTEVFNFDM